jgi:hypothetical protein
MKIKSMLRACADAAAVEAEVRRISENAVTHPPCEKLRWRPMSAPRDRKRKVFQPWGKRHNWQMIDL